MWRRSSTVTVASLAAVAAILSGCSSSASSTSSPHSTAASLKGAPIKLLLIGQITDPVQGQPVPEVASGAMAAADAINASGGIHGRPLRVTVCDDADNETKAAACARQASNLGAVATVADNTEFGTAVDPILLSEHVAAVGANPLTPADFSLPNMFPIEPGGAATTAGEAVALVKAGAKHIVVARVDNPASAIADTFVNAALAPYKLKVFKDVPVPTTVPDLSSYVADATSGGADGVLIAMNQNQGAHFIEALRQAGAKLPVATASSAVPPNELPTLGAAAEGLYVSSEFRPVDTGGPGISQFLADMKQYEPAAAVNDFSINGWVSVEAFTKSVAQLNLTNITSTTVLAGMKQVRNLDLGGIVPSWSTVPLKVPGLSQNFNPSVMLARIQHGKIIPLVARQFTYPIPGTAPVS
jgi:branched-chain amino acid transport system substrate-binding protein